MTYITPVGQRYGGEHPEDEAATDRAGVDQYLFHRGRRKSLSVFSVCVSCQGMDGRSLSPFAESQNRSVPVLGLGWGATLVQSLRGI